MEIFTKVLQGPYAYLLVLQVMVVSGLCLSLIWLVMRRTQDAAQAMVLAGEKEATATVPVVDTAKIDELNARIVELEKENASLKAGGGDVKTLQEKVKYLESKLLEYEILQEEIGTLSALKMENEHLRKQLAARGQTPVVPAVPPGTVPEPPAVPVTPPASTMAASSPEPALPSEPLGIDDLSGMGNSNTPPPEPSISSQPAPPGVVMFPPEPAPAPANATPAPDGESAGLEGLLKQIDEIGGPPATKP